MSARRARRIAGLAGLLLAPPVLHAASPAWHAHRPVRAAHPMHVSSTQIDLSRDGRRLEITVRIFTDDLEAALQKAGTPVSVLQGDTAVVQRALQRYLSSRLQLSVNGGAPAPGMLIGYEREDDATLLFVELALPAALTSLVVHQQVMLEMFEDQTNLLHYKGGTVTRSALLRRGTERATFTF